MFVLLSSIMILGLIGLAPQVFAPNYSDLINSNKNQSFPDDNALIIIFSDNGWSGEYGSQGSRKNVEGHGFWYYNFSCTQNESYNVKFSKKSQGGNDLILNIIQNGKLLNHGKIDSGSLTLSGKCFTSQVSGNNNDFIEIHTDKDSYLSNDTILIDGKSKFLPYFTLLNFKIINPHGEIVWTEKFSSKKDNTFTKNPKIQDYWGPSGNYTIVAFFDDYNQVIKKINIVQKTETYQFKVNSTDTKQEIKNNSVLFLPHRIMDIMISGFVKDAHRGDKIDVLILQPYLDNNKELFRIEEIRLILTDNENYATPSKLNRDFVEGCYEIMANYQNNAVGKLQFFVTDKSIKISDDSKSCNKEVLSYISDYFQHHMTLDELTSHLRDMGWSDDQIKHFHDFYKGRGIDLPTSPNKWHGIDPSMMITGVVLAVGLYLSIMFGLKRVSPEYSKQKK